MYEVTTQKGCGISNFSFSECDPSDTLPDERVLKDLQLRVFSRCDYNTARKWGKDTLT